MYGLDYNLLIVNGLVYLQKLITAANQGRVGELRLCLENGADINYKDVGIL